MDHISKFFQKHRFNRAFYQFKEIISIQEYLASGKIHIVDHTGTDRVISREDLIII